MAGFVYQTVFRNPLASPDIIGVSSGASVGAAFAILFVSSGALSTTVCAFAGGLAAVFLSLGLAAAAPGRSKMSLVLAGIAVHALAQTLLMLLKLTADPEKELASIEYWIMGSLAAVTRSRVWFPVPVVLVCCAAIFALHRQALLLSIEEGEARLLGVRVGAMRLLLLTLATMTVAAVVSVTGLISFVGLLAPHSARLLAGHNRRSACLLSGLLGSALLLAADRLVEAMPDVVGYFPAYELLNDELRDYRFYAADMVHPSDVAVDYVWQRFCEACLTDEARRVMDECDAIRKDLAHKPFRPDSDGYKKFLEQILLKIDRLNEKYPYLDFQKERELCYTRLKI